MSNRDVIAARSRVSLWTASAALIALPIAVPIVAILLTLLSPQSEAWLHLRESLLAEYFANTVLLLLCVAVITGVVGVSTAWIVATKNFPGRGVFAWALILPIAVPAYIVAYAYADFTSFTGPLQTLLRDLGLVEGPLPTIRSLPGAAFVLGFTLYPYVFLFAYNAFAQQARPLAEAARTLGASPQRAFFRIALPHARPAVAGGMALALMETAADFGVVDFFGVATFTNGIFRTWYAQGEHQAAMQLAACLFIVVLVLVGFEQWARSGLHANPVSRNASAPRAQLSGGKALLAFLLCALPVTLGLLLPVAVLLAHAVETGDPLVGRSFAQYAWNSVNVAVITAVLATLVAVVLSYAARIDQNQRNASPVLRVSIRTATLGYALPGMVLAVGVITPLTSLDKWIAGVWSDLFDQRIGLLLTGSIAALIFVYLARFITVAFNSCQSGLEQIHPNYDQAARSLGASRSRLLTRVHLPIMTPAVLTALLLVFVDVIKELPATLILRPFNFDTLATRAYRLASDERIAEASTASVLIVAVGLIPALMIAWQNLNRERTVGYVGAAS